MTITSSGLGTGLDIKSIVDSLVAADRAPISNRLDKMQVQASTRLSAIGQLKSALSTFKDALGQLTSLSSLQSRTVDINPADFYSATATSSSLPGTYDITVLSLAAAQKLSSGPFTGSDTIVGTGTLAITVNGKTDKIAIGPDNGTLAGIRDAINSSASNTGVKAALVTADDGVHLIVNSSATGSKQTITIDALEAGSGLEALEFGAGTTNKLTQTQAAADAQVKIDGFTVSSATNTLDSAVDGISLKLLKADPNTATTLTIGVDNAPVTAAVKKFVDSYNSLNSTIAKLTAYDATTKTAGPLLGDATVRNLQSTVRRAIASASGGTGNALANLAAIGIQGSLTGTLTLDTTKLGTAMNADLGAVGKLFNAPTTGFNDRLGGVLGQLLNTGGSLSTSEQTLQTQLKTIASRRNDLDLRMAQVQARYQKQFDAMDSLVQQLNSSGSAFLTALNNLSTTTSTGTSTG